MVYTLSSCIATVFGLSLAKRALSRLHIDQRLWKSQSGSTVGILIITQLFCLAEVMSTPSVPETDVRSRRETRENRGRGRGRGGRKFFKTSHDVDKTNLVHNVPFLKHGGSINACMLWNLRVADYADTEDLDIGQEIRLGQIDDDHEKINDYVALLQESMMPTVEDSDAQRLRPR